MTRSVHQLSVIVRGLSLQYVNDIEHARRKMTLPVASADLLVCSSKSVDLSGGSVSDVEGWKKN